MNPRALEHKESLNEFLGDAPLQALHRVGELVQHGPFAGTLAGAVFSLAGVRAGERELTIYHLPATTTLILDLLVNLDLLRSNLIEIKVKEKGDIYKLYKKARLAVLLARVTENISTAMTRYREGTAKAWEEAVVKETSEQPKTEAEQTHNDVAT